MLSVIYALSANICFSTASLYFTDFSRQVSSLWINYFKVCVAFIAFFIVCLLFLSSFYSFFNLSNESFILFFISGVVGLIVGDFFIFKAFATLGSGRVLMICGFQPLMLGLASYYLFNDAFSFNRLIALFFLVTCLFCFSLESFKDKGHWDVKGLCFAMIGITMDALGILMTKQAFRLSPEVSFMSANLIRSGAAVAGFFIISQIPYFKLNLIQPFLNLNRKDKGLALMASCLGTFLSLTFYLQAIQIGNIATVSAISGTSPLLATLLEVFQGRKKMTRYLVIATLSFMTGVGILLFI